MEHTDFKTGWSIKAFIEVKKNSSFAFINEWKCDKSGRNLQEECLLVLKTNFRHRGNETDELQKYNRDATPNEYLSVWEEWDEKKAAKKIEIIQMAGDYNIKVSFL